MALRSVSSKGSNNGILNDRVEPRGDVAVTDLLEQVATAVPNHIRMPLAENYVGLVDATEKALDRMREEESLPETLIDRKAREIRQSIRRKLRQIALTETPWDLGEHSRLSPALPESADPAPTFIDDSDPTPATGKIKQNLRRLALSDRTNRDPYLHAPSGKAEKYPAQVLVKLRMSALDEDIRDKSRIAPAYIDTGAHFTAVSASLLDVKLDIKGVAGHTFNIIAVVCEKLPNDFQGVLLGQHTFLDSMEFKLTPSRILRARNPVEEEGLGAADVWGWIDITCFADTEDRVFSFDED
ncbi:MAG: hypothetical protein M1815_002687 [Lichina confinis]|nr:MAG: hypothetical protein M1815_002687 [Lichina confinis]